MSRRPRQCPTRQHLTSRRSTSRHWTGTSLLILTFFIAGAARGAAQSSLIQPATPNPARQARSEAWLQDFGSQRPKLLLAIVALERERDGWNSSSGARCRRAQGALGQVDRDSLLGVADYRLMSRVGDALVALEGAIRACRERRYFELDYRLGLVRRFLDEAVVLAETQSRR